LLLGDSVTTDHISPAGEINPEYPAGKYLKEKGIKEEATISFDTYAGVQSAANQLTPLSAQQYGDLLWEAHYNDGKHLQTTFTAADLLQLSLSFLMRTTKCPQPI